MFESAVGRILWRAVEDPVFRARLLVEPGSAIPEEGFVTSDEEMSTLGGNVFESLHHLTERQALERINAMARGYQRS